jgi:hypothetical protein
MTAAWVAVVISAVTVVANIFGVIRSGRAQREIARGERIGDRQIDTYIDLLHWVKKFEDLSDASSLFEVIGAMRLDDDLEVRSVAFASDAVRLRVEEFKNAWFALYQRLQKLSAEEKAALWRDLASIIKVWAEGRGRPSAKEWIGRAELEAMIQAREAVADAIRQELLGEMGARRKPASWAGLLGRADPLRAQRRQTGMGSVLPARRRD